MAYFPHAYKKTFVAASVQLAPNAGDKTDDLTAGQLALASYKSGDLIPGGTVAASDVVMLAMGSYHANDKIGPHHGGYTESVKSKGINPKFISRLYHAPAQASVAAQVTVEAEGDCFGCGVERYLRIDVKGSPALRFLGRNSYFVADWTEKCCVAGQTSVDPFVVLETWAKQIINEPLVTPFLNVSMEEWDVNTSAWVPVAYEKLVNGNPVASTIYDSEATAVHTVTTQSHGKFRIVLDGAYVDTKFGDCSFRPTDFYEKEPVIILASELDETGDACNVACTTITETATAKQGRGFGESVLREVILSNRYAQEPFSNDARIREILEDTALGSVDRNGSYDLFYVLHSIPRSYNPSGMHNSDQYLLCIAAEAGSQASTDALTVLNDLAAASGVAVEAIG